MKFLKHRSGLIGILTTLFASLSAVPAFAFAQPTANSILFSVYNLIIVGMINNGLTYIVGFLAILAGAFFLMQQKLVVTLFCLIGGILFLSAGTIATAFGYCF